VLPVGLEVPGSTIAAVALSVTVTNPTADSFLTVAPNYGVTPTASNLNFGPGQIKQVLVIASIGNDGRVDFYNHVGSVDVVADVFGHFA